MIGKASGMSGGKQVAENKKDRASRPKQQPSLQFRIVEYELRVALALFRAGRPALCLPQIAFYVKIQIF